MSAASQLRSSAQPTNFPELRGPVRELCAQFGSDYWQRAEADGYPEAFVRALTEAGWLSALIPEEYGGAGLGLTEASVILEEINRSGANSGACHAQMYIMGTLLRHGSAAQKRDYLPRIAHRRAAAAVVRRHRADHRHRHHQAQDDGACGDGRQLRRQRSENLDLARAAFRSAAAAGAHHAAVEQIKRKNRGTVRLPGRSAPWPAARTDGAPDRNMVSHDTNEVFFDDSRFRPSSLIGEEGRAFRYILDGMNAERILIAAECIGRRPLVRRARQRLRE